MPLGILGDILKRMNSLLEKLARSASWVMWLGRGLFLSVIILLVVMRSLITIIRIDGKSMDPTLANGQWVLIDLVSKRFQPWQEGDVVILRFPGDPIHSLYVKRIIGMPGDTIKIDKGMVSRNGSVLTEPYLALNTMTEEGPVRINGTVPPNQYLVFGDNRFISNDSRFFGYVPKDDLYGKVIQY